MLFTSKFRFFIQFASIFYIFRIFPPHKIHASGDWKMRRDKEMNCGYFSQDMCHIGPLLAAKLVRPVLAWHPLSLYGFFTILWYPILGFFQQDKRHPVSQVKTFIGVNSFHYIWLNIQCCNIGLSFFLLYNKQSMFASGHWTFRQSL